MRTNILSFKKSIHFPYKYIRRTYNTLPPKDFVKYDCYKHTTATTLSLNSNMPLINGTACWNFLYDIYRVSYNREPIQQPQCRLYIQKAQKIEKENKAFQMGAT